MESLNFFTKSLLVLPVIVIASLFVYFVSNIIFYLFMILISLLLIPAIVYGCYLYVFDRDKLKKSNITIYNREF